MYSFGAMLSFTVAHVSIVALRVQDARRGARLPRPAEPPRRAGSTGPSSRSSAGSAPALAWLVVVVQEPATRWAGLGWLALGFVVYVVYRRRVVHLPLRETVRAPAWCSARRSRSSTGRSLVPVVRAAESEEALVVAAGSPPSAALAIVALHVLEVPLELPLTRPARGEDARPTSSSTTPGRSSSATACGP